MRSQTIENPLVSPFRQSFEPSLAELAQARREHNKYLAETLDEERDHIDTRCCILKAMEDDLSNYAEYHAIIYNLKSAMQLMENLANRLEAV